MGIPQPLSLARRIGGLSPFGPIVGKELQTASRRMRNHWLRMLYLGGLLLFLLLIFVSYRPYSYGSNVARIQGQAELGRAFFATFSMFCVIGMGLIAPILTSTAINAERLGNTLNVLLMTPITSWQIVAGKLFARMLIALMLIGLSLPVLAVVRLLGGVELWQMIAVVCICTAFAIASGALGLFLSTLMNRAFAVILAAYAVQGLLYCFVPFCIAILASGSTFNRIIWHLCTINPPMNATYLSVPDTPLPTFNSTWYWLPCVIVQLSFATLLLIASSWIVRRQERRAAQRQAAAAPPFAAGAAPDAGAHAAVEAGAHAAADPAPAPAPQLARIANNPVLWREMRRPLLKARSAAVLAVACFGLLFVSYGLLASIHALNDRNTQVGYAFIFHTALCLLVGVLSATAIAQEKESDTWTLLLTTPLSPSRIVMGKLAGLSCRLLWPTVFIIVHFMFFILGGVVSAKAVLIVLCVMVGCNTLWAATGMYLSLRIKRVTTAVILNLLLVLFIYVGVPMILAILGEVTTGTDNWAETSLMGVPYVYEEAAINRLTPTLYGRSYGNWVSLPIGNVSISEFQQIVATMVVIHVLLAALVLSVTIRGFDRTVGRATEEVR
jgi:ABC-type transport system involved in multi-copper enzyme maturation permease subunit